VSDPDSPDTIVRDTASRIFADLADDPTVGVEAAIERAGLDRVSDDAVRETVRGVVDRNAEQVREEGMTAFSALMGECMAELRGRADGEVVSRLLREEIGDRAAD
jgi:glutamyl-tRNA(Gln) amidotransferase subunit E